MNKSKKIIQLSMLLIVLGSIIYSCKKEETTVSGYKIVISDAITNGVVTCEKSHADEGEVIELNIVPNAGYKKSSLMINSNKTDEESFIMPNEPVIVTATFEESAGESSGDFSRRKIDLFLDMINPDELVNRDRLDVTDDQYSEIANFTSNLVSNVSSTTEKYNIIMGWLSDNITYVNGSVNTAYAVFTNREAVCGGYVKLQEVMLVSQGIPCAEGYTNVHAFQYVYLDDHWVLSEPTYGRTYTDVNQYNAILIHQTYVISGEFKLGFWHGITIMAYTGTSNDVTIPENINGLEINNIYSELQSAVNINTLTLQNNITNIASDPEDLRIVFLNVAEFIITQNNSNLTMKGSLIYETESEQLIVPRNAINIEINDISIIDKEMIFNCSNLKQLRIGSRVTTIRPYAVSGCSLLSKVFISNSVTTINDNAFVSCGNFTIYSDNPIAENFAERNNITIKPASEY